MTESTSIASDTEPSRPPCFHCGESYSATTEAHHVSPVECDVCPRCRTMPACFTCRNMYCSCEVHQH